MPDLGSDVYDELRAAVRRRIEARRPQPYLVALIARAWSWYRRPAGQGHAVLALAALVLVAGAVTGLALRSGGSLSQPSGWAVAPGAADTTQAGGTAGAPLLASASGRSDRLDDAAGQSDDMRIEMQTADPNVRIIFFTPRSHAGTRGN
jgi:hypothetical protein